MDGEKRKNSFSRQRRTFIVFSLDLLHSCGRPRTVRVQNCPNPKVSEFQTSNCNLSKLFESKLLFILNCPSPKGPNPNCPIVICANIGQLFESKLLFILNCPNSKCTNLNCPNSKCTNLNCPNPKCPF